jgi:hypothetical protein
LIYHIPYFTKRQARLIPYCTMTTAGRRDGNTHGYEPKTHAERGIEGF